VRNCIKLCYVPQSCPLTESDIDGSSGNKRKFFLCRNLSFCLKYQSAQSLKVFRFFQEMKEYNLDQVKPEHDLSLAKVSDLLASKETERTNKVQSATVLPQLIKRQASSENHVASNKLLLSFMKKRKNPDPAADAHLLDFKQSCSKRESNENDCRPSSNVLNLCHLFCVNSRRHPMHQVHLYFPF
jgi:hypothetical protein